MLKVQAHSEEVTCEVVVQHKVIHLRLCGGKLRVVDKFASVADFGVEHLAGAQCLVGFDEIDDVIWHTVVTSPGYIFHALVDEDGRDVVLLLKDFRCLGGEGCGCVVGGEVVDTRKRDFAHK